MVESSDDPSLSDRSRSFPNVNAVSDTGGADIRAFPTFSTTTSEKIEYGSVQDHRCGGGGNGDRRNDSATSTSKSSECEAGEKSRRPLAAPPQTEGGDGGEVATVEPAVKPSVGRRFYNVLKQTLFYSWLNVLLVFVPVGICCKAARVNPTVVFAMNAIAIVPLAGLLSHATESIASEMGDTIGALMNVTFGNAVELIIL